MPASAVRVARRFVWAKKRVTVDAKFATLWKVVHLTPGFLGDEVMMRADPPRGPYEDQRGFVIEDDVTPRVSVAETIKDALKGLEGSGSLAYEVYGAGPRKKGVQVTDPNQWLGDCPSSIGNEYGPNFDWTEFAEEEDIDPHDDWVREDKTHLCVPDLKRTRERWLMKPTKMVWLGKYQNGKLELTQAQLDHLVDDVLKIPEAKRERLVDSLLR